MLLYPEGMVKLNGSAGEILRRCDGERTLAEIVADLERAFDATGLAGDVTAFVVHGRGEQVAGDAHRERTPQRTRGPGRRCGCCWSSPIAARCTACSATTRSTSRAPDEELATDDWLRVLREARELGAVQLGLSGGEPLVRDDLEAIVAEAHALGLLHQPHHLRRRADRSAHQALKAAGLDHIQLSFQDCTREMNDFLSSTRTFELKSKVAALIKRTTIRWC